MFSCFCVKKKPKRITGSKKPAQVIYQNSNLTLKYPNLREVEGSTTLKNPKDNPGKVLQKLSGQQLVEESINQKQVKQIISVRQVQNESGSILNTSLSSDSDTIPYLSRNQASEFSTPRQRRFQSKKGKESVLKQIRQAKTISQNPIERIFSFDRQIGNFHTRPVLKISNGMTSIKGSVSIDYSKYSQQDRQVSSSEILNLDQEMETKLQQLQKNLLEQPKTLMQKSERQQISYKHDYQAHKSSRFHKSKKYQDIENDFEELERAENQIHNALMKKSNAIVNSKHKISLKDVKFDVPQIGKETEDLQLKSLHELVEKTVKSELDIIQNANLFFSQQQSLRAPQSLDAFKKTLKYQETSQIQQTLQEAQNSFYCNSINEEFSRALITKQLDLALKIFQKMTYGEKNSTDTKGYFPVHLAILQTVLDDNVFQIAKKLMYHPEVRMDIKGPTGWSPLQEAISYVSVQVLKKHIRLTPNVFVASHRKKLSIIRQSLAESSQILSKMRDFEMCLDVKVDSYIPLVGNLTPNDTITIGKKGDKLLIEYTLVGYEFLSCKRRDMGFLIDGQTILAINRSKDHYCDLLEELDKQEIQMLVVESLQTQTKKVDPSINNAEMKEARTMFDNQITDRINDYLAKKFLFTINYTSMTEKRMPQKLSMDNHLNINQTSSPLAFLSSWSGYLAHEQKINIKPKNRNKKIELQMWLSDQFGFQIQNLIKIFELFALSNPLAKIISDFLRVHFNTVHKCKGKFPVKIDVPINFSLYFNLEFRGLKFQNFKQNSLSLDSTLKKISRKEFQNIAQSKEKRAFAISAFT